MICIKQSQFYKKDIPSWYRKLFDSLKLIKIYSIGDSRFIVYPVGHTYITLFTISHFLSEILKIPVNGRRRNSEIFTFSLILKSVETRKAFTILPIMVGQRWKYWFLEPLKRSFHHSENASINIGRKSISSQWLWPFQLILQGVGNF